VSIRQAPVDLPAACRWAFEDSQPNSLKDSRRLISSFVVDWSNSTAKILYYYKSSHLASTHYNCESDFAHCCRSTRQDSANRNHSARGQVHWQWEDRDPWIANKRGFDNFSYQLIPNFLRRKESVLVRKIKTLASLLVIAIVASCALFPSKGREELEQYTPYLKGLVVPLAEPEELKYSSVSYSFQILVHEKAELSGVDICELFLLDRPRERMACVADAQEQSDKIETAEEERIFEGVTNVSRFGEGLKWDIKTLALSIDGQEYRPSQPINHVEVISNRYGRPSNINISFPALEDAGARDIPYPGTKDYLQAVNLFKQSILVFPEKPIVTGGILQSVPVSQMVAEMLAFWSGQDKQQVLSVIDSGKDNLKYSVAGWSHINKVKVLVTELRYNGSVKIVDKPLLINTVGYVLLNLENGHILQRENLTHMRYGKSEFNILYEFISKPRNDK
jgi:hypothetical protein